MGGSESKKAGGPPKQDLQIDRAKYYDGPNKVQLAYSVLGGIPGVQAFHTSVIVNNVEYFFDNNGIESSNNLASHWGIVMQKEQRQGGGGAGVNFQNSSSTQVNSGGGSGDPTSRTGVPPGCTVVDMGSSNKTGSQLKEATRQYFNTGDYDLLRKNCNSFSDVALFYLLGKRLDPQFRSLEKFGQRTGAASLLAGQGYQANPKVQGFDVEVVVQKLDPAAMWSTPGYTLGGGGAQGSAQGSAQGAPSNASLSPEEMRRKRLEALEKRAADEKAAG